LHSLAVVPEQEVLLAGAFVEVDQQQREQAEELVLVPALSPQLFSVCAQVQPVQVVFQP
jgi:hypothetical protein